MDVGIFVIALITLVYPAVSGGVIWLLRRWMRKEIIVHLTNGDTPVAKYAHDARDFAEKALKETEKGNDLLVKHLMNTDIHNYGNRSTTANSGTPEA